MDWITPLAILITLIFIGFFAGIEIAFVSANKLSIELRRKQGTFSGIAWGQYADKPTQFIGSTLIGFNLILVVYGLLWSDFMAPLWNLKFWKSFNTENPYIRLLIETILSTTILLIVEFIFKALFRAKNDKVLSNGIITWFTNLCYNLLSGFATVFIEMAEWVLRYLFNVSLKEKKEPFSKNDLENIVKMGRHPEEDNTADINKELFENALSLSDTKVRECLIHRREIEALDITTDMNTLKQKFISTKLSKLVVYENNIDNIIGYVHQLDLFKKPAELKEILLPIPLVPESMSATDLMNKFSKERKSIAWVVDEFGGTAGIVTMEDVLEEIFGEIKDEYDTEEQVEKQLSNNEFIFSGRLELDYIIEKYKLDFEKIDETETLSGFIIKHRDEIPRQKETIIIGNYQFDILNVSDTRIEMVKMKILI